MLGRPLRAAPFGHYRPHVRRLSYSAVQMLPIGRANETDTASALARLQKRTTGLSAETDTAYVRAPAGGGETDDAPTSYQKYVRAGATGTGSGNDWTNAYTNLPATLIRDTTYWIAEGSYGAYTFDDATSGALKIRVKKATDTFNGGGANWLSSYGDGTANFTNLVFATSHYIVDGTTGGGPGAWNSGHGIVIYNTTGEDLIYSAGGVSNITVRHAKIYSDRGAATPPESGGFIGGFKGTLGFASHLFSHCQISDMYGPVFYIRDTTGLTVQYCYLARNKNSADWHSEGMTSGGSMSGIIVRWNIWDQIEGTAIFAGINYGTNDGMQIYGNIFARHTGPTMSYNTDGSNNMALTNARIYNNTVLDIPDMQPWNVSQGGWSVANGSGNICYNNIFYQNVANSIGWTGVDDYNYASRNLRTPENIDLDPLIVSGEAHGQDGGSANPFFGYNADPIVADLRATTNAGIDTNSSVAGNAVDMFGTVRGSVNNWTRGAIQQT